jgi:hypothetical protein
VKKHCDNDTKLSSPSRSVPLHPCIEFQCAHNATLTCHGTDCGAALCIVHTNKDIITGATYCFKCNETLTIAEKMKHIWTQREDTNNECIIS